MHTIKCKTPELQNQTQLPFHCLGPLVTLIKVKFLDGMSISMVTKAHQILYLYLYFSFLDKRVEPVCMCGGVNVTIQQVKYFTYVNITLLPM